MKKFAILFSFVVLLCMSCNSTSSAHENADFIRKEVSEMNAKLPINFGNGVTMLSVQYEYNTVIYLYSISNINEDNVNLMKNLLHYGIKAEAESSSKSKIFYETLIATGGQIEYIYRTESGIAITFIISNSELKEIME